MFPTTILFFYFAGALALIAFAPSIGAAGSPQPVRITSQKLDSTTDISARRRHRGGGGGFGYGVHDNSGPRSSG